MAWFDTYVNAPAIITDGLKETDELQSIVNGTVVQRFTRSVTVETTEYRGLTLVAAKAGAETLATPTMQTRYIRENPAGAYTLQKTEETKTAWVEDT